MFMRQDEKRYVMTGAVANLEDIKKSLRRPEVEVAKTLVYVTERNRGGYQIEIMKQKFGYVALVAVRGFDVLNRNDILTRILMDMNAVEIDPIFAYDEVKRTSGKELLLNLKN